MTGQSSSSFIKATLFVIIAFFFMALFGVVNKIASTSEDLLWISFLTYVFSFLLLLPFVAYRGFNTVKTKVFTIHFLRAFIGLSASLFYLLSILHVPLANASLLYSTSPFFIPLISLVVFRSKLSLTSWLAIFIGFLGIALIIRPDMASFEAPGNFFALFAGMLLAAVFVLVRLLVKTESILTILFYFTLLGSLLQLPLALLDYKNFPTESAIPVILSISGIFMVTQICLAIAYQNAAPSKIGVFQYLTVLFIGLFDWALWNEVPTGTDLIGAAVVIIAGIIAIREGSTENK